MRMVKTSPSARVGGLPRAVFVFGMICPLRLYGIRREYVRIWVVNRCFTPIHHPYAGIDLANSQ